MERILPEKLWAVYSVECIIGTPEQVRPVYANVLFGQSSNRCRGAGICQVELYSGKKIGDGKDFCRQAVGMIGVNEKGRLFFRFVKYSICKKPAQAQFEKGVFQVKEDFLLPEAVISRLGGKVKNIRAGAYSVEKEQHHYTIVF